MHGWAARHRGLATENSFTFAMRSLRRSKMPKWFREIREATPLEDMKGFDAFATLDVGEVPIQIKSSTEGADDYLRRYPNQDVVIVIIHEGAHEQDIRKYVLLGLRQWREQTLRNMPRWRRAWMPLFNFSFSRSL